MAAVFTEMGQLPSPAQVEEQLHFGSAPPDAFADGTYAVCSAAECDAVAAAGVSIYLRNSSYHKLITLSSEASNRPCIIDRLSFKFLLQECPLSFIKGTKKGREIIENRLYIFGQWWPLEKDNA